MLNAIYVISSASVLIQLAGATVTTVISIQLATGNFDADSAAIVVAAYSAGFALGCFFAPATIRVWATFEHLRLLRHSALSQ